MTWWKQAEGFTAIRRWSMFGVLGIPSRIYIHCYTQTAVWKEFLRIEENFVMAILELLEEEVTIAYPRGASFSNASRWMTPKQGGIDEVLIRRELIDPTDGMDRFADILIEDAVIEGSKSCRGRWGRSGDRCLGDDRGMAGWSTCIPIFGNRRPRGSGVH
ncbi:MAG: hypothetical protein MZV70_47165 [Desulfobacterales bacterium]|nr:hypothetical protein [Desulfobacterales bacterium]